MAPARYAERVHCLVTAGPTYEPLDEVRRLTNFSTGKLGTLLANHLVQAGHQVTLLLGSYATYRGESTASATEHFTSSSDLHARLERHAGAGVDAVYHAAAVSDFKFGRVWERAGDGILTEVQEKKVSTRDRNLFVELVPAFKIISQLRGWFPKATLVGWKYEVDGDRASVIEKARVQVRQNATNACVANGSAYGFGFGIVGEGSHSHFSDTAELYRALEHLALHRDARETL